MPERVEAWWARRQWSKGAEVPYAIGEYRGEWARWPVLVRQYHPEFNAGVVLSQVPPAADVWLQWQCEVGHLFVATPDRGALAGGVFAPPVIVVPRLLRGGGTAEGSTLAHPTALSEVGCRGAPDRRRLRQRLRAVGRIRR